MKIHILSFTTDSHGMARKFFRDFQCLSVVKNKIIIDVVEALLKIPIYQIDAFAGDVFSGNPAAVCPLEGWLADSVMQAIAGENNLSETAFFVPEGNGYRIRWFTPVQEVNLCGHATLAAAFVIFSHLAPASHVVSFTSKSGPLEARRNQDLLTLDFPARLPEPCPAPPELLKGLQASPIEVLRSEDYMAVFASEEEVRDLAPEIEKFRGLPLRGIIATARGNGVDFVSRFFAPKFGIDEDPVTGSAHCALTPYWAGKLKKERLHARQLSQRGGELFCENRGERIFISGRAVQYMEGYITLPGLSK